jgi:hypothetical protein
MVAIMGTFQNGYVKLDHEYLSEKPVKVIVTFLEDIEVSSAKGLSLADFSFSKSRKALENYTGSFVDSLIEERRMNL